MRTTLVLALLSAAALAQERRITLGGLVREMTDLERLAALPATKYVARQASSYDRRSKTPDDPEGWFANRDAGHFSRVEGEEHVLLDVAGPGVVTRIWSANPRGRLRFFFDGEKEPSFEASMSDLLKGRVPPFGPPFAYEAARGCNLYFPLPYARHCRITCDKGGFYYHVGYRTYPEGTTVETFRADRLADAADDLAEVRATLEDPDRAALGSLVRLDRHKLTARSPAHIEGEVIRRLVLRPGDVTPETLRTTILSIRFDGHETVRAPLGDFFGTGPGLNPYDSLPFRVAKDGALTCRWVMPFQQRAEIRLEGDPNLVVMLDVISDAPYWTKRSLYFHAKWRAQEVMVTGAPRDWNYVALRGQGLYVGNALSVTNPVRNWWGEGDEKIYVDGEKFPSHFGTGTEDYYGYAWCCPVPFQRPYHAQTRCDGPINFGHTSVNRWHILDAIPFERSLRFDMEVWHSRRGVEVTYGAVNYWYARPGGTDNVPPVERKRLKITDLPEPEVKRIEGALEAETLRVATTGGVAQAQDTSGFAGLWSGDKHLWWRDAKVGDVLTVQFDAPAAGRYEVGAYLTMAPDYGRHRLSINGAPAGAPVDLFATAVKPAPRRSLGAFRLTKTGNLLRVEVVGTNPKARPRNFMFGLDCLVLKKRK